MGVWEELGQRLRELSREEAVKASPPIRRGRVIDTDPLTLDLGGGEEISEEDDDVEVDASLDDLVPPLEPGDVLRVHQDTHGDYVVSGRIRG